MHTTQSGLSHQGCRPRDPYLGEERREGEEERGRQEGGEEDRRERGSGYKERMNTYIHLDASTETCEESKTTMNSTELTTKRHQERYLRYKL